jgi:hypothetical protein
VLRAGFRKCHRRPQHRLPLGCELCESVAGWASQVAEVMLTTQALSRQVEYITSQLVSSDAVHMRACTGIKKCPQHRNRPKSDTCLYELFWSQRPRKSPPAVMSSSRETPCMLHYEVHLRPYINQSVIMNPKWLKKQNFGTIFFLWKCPV